MRDALLRAIAAKGGQSGLARAINEAAPGKRPVSQGTVWYWLNDRQRVPAERVLDVEKASGVSRHELRPDLYPSETTEPEAAQASGAADAMHPPNPGKAAA